MGAEARAEFEVWYQENAPAFFKSTYPVADAAWAVWQHSRATLAAVERDRDALFERYMEAVDSLVHTFQRDGKTMVSDGGHSICEGAFDYLDLPDRAVTLDEWLNAIEAKRHALGRDEAGTKGGNGA